MEPNQTVSDLMLKLQLEKKAAVEFQERKHDDWNDNYELYRNKVRTNRLTQRQAVNIPLVKETVNTKLSKIDDPPSIDWKNKDGDMQKELYYQEIWNDQYKQKKVEWIDIVDKKNVLLYGLSTKFLNIGKKGVDFHVLDVWDVLYDPMMNPLDIESARFIVRQNIYRPLREILADDRYTEAGKEALKMHVLTPSGLIQDEKNKEEFSKKMERLKALGVENSDFALFAGGDVLVALTEHYTKVWNTKKQEFERKVVVYANDAIELLDETLVELIGVDFWPFVLWFEDPETTDVYPDGTADLVRTPNKIVNVWYSQLVENRTLQNFQMHWYDSTVSDYQPQVYEPGPGRMLPAPGAPKDTISPVQINGLEETLGAIDYLTKVVERGSGIVGVDKGVGEDKQTTLGEVEILVGKSMERAVTISKFYRGSWYELACKWDKMMQANAPKIMELQKTGRSGKMYKKTVYRSDWVGNYEPVVSSSSEQEQEKVKGIQKFQVAKSMFPNNPALNRIVQKRIVDLLGVTPEEAKEIEEAEKQMQEMIQQREQMSMNQGGQAGADPLALANDIEQQVGQLNTINA